MAKNKQQGDALPRGPNWTTAETLKLVEAAWRTEMDIPADKGESAALLNTRVYERFKLTCGGSTPQSEKAVIDKKNSLSMAFKVIVLLNNNRVIGSPGQQSWFEITRDKKTEQGCK
ncbi:hypothetical protein PI124_g11288 [Phytophthora idaei]|nr:hypothetical protein PI125_g10753 [Phytophthora idaei]KAG3153471.1 hypothetical protein PI126_g10072 [Phytophthora idaei]KAG3243913.1 hypothetical protein PI124_g11288 [Phytophthora idaei]